MNKGFIRQSFKRQLFIIFMAVTLALVVIGGLVTIQGFQMRLKADHMRSDEEQMKIINSRILDMLETSDKVLASIEENDTLMNSLRMPVRDTRFAYSALYEVTGDIRNFATVDLFVGSECRYTTAMGSVNRILPEYYSILREASEHAGENVYSAEIDYDGDSAPSLVIARKVLDSPQSAYAIVKIPTESIEDILTGAINARDGFILANRFIRPICSLGTATDNKDISLVRSNLFGGRNFNEDSKNNIYITEAGNTGLLCIYITPPVLEPSAVRAGYQIVMIMVLLGIILCFFASSRLSSLVAKPLNALSVAMRRFRKGDFDAKIEIARDDEFGQLATGFNKMTSQLKETIEERVKAQERLNEARIEMMQAQLNPHFLYNTLDTIKWVAKANQVPEVATLSASLAGLLRTGISADQFITLEKEIETVRNYCDIQKIRFDDSFDFEVDVAPELLHFFVPKLILQPMVENSIIHGFEGRRDGMIKITAETVDEDKLVIDIVDNGRGISDEMIAALESNDPEALKGHLGFNNVNTIIKLHFGREYGVRAERVPEGGTHIAIELPVLTEPPGTDTGESEEN